jgi:hypothetical protein
MLSKLFLTATFQIRTSAKPKFVASLVLELAFDFLHSDLHVKYQLVFFVKLLLELRYDHAIFLVIFCGSSAILLIELLDRCSVLA